MFSLGMFAVLAQVIFMREALVVFSGNELTVGTILAGWLTGISLGACCYRIFSRISNRMFLLACVLLVVAIFLPVQVYAVRLARNIFGVPVGEYAALGIIMAGSFLTFLPSCFCIGLCFPLACELVKDDFPVSLVYLSESMGSVFGGILATFMLLKVQTPYEIVFTASCIAIAGFLMIVPLSVRSKMILTVSCFILLILILLTGSIGIVEESTGRLRWRAAGILPEDKSNKSVRLICSEDTVYQNLALFESNGQYMLYGHGRLMFVFPDPTTYENNVNFVMGQKPDARRILLLGGNPLGDIPELLKYPVERLVYVELDPGVGRMLRSVMPDEYNRVMASDRVYTVSSDGPGYIAGCIEQFDAVFINAPEPSTAWENRFYTREFYQDIRRILAPTGFMYTDVKLSVRLQSETASIGASIYRTLRNVFPVVMITGGDVNSIFAGGTDSKLTFDRQELFRRSSSAGIRNDYFIPEFFLGYDGIDPDKTRFVADRLDSADVPENSNERPVTYFYQLLLWSRISASSIGRVLGWLGSVDSRLIVFLFFVMGCMCWLIGMVNNGSCRWSRIVAGTVIGTTGFCSMALEIILIFMFQALFGYVYTRIGLIVGMFMLGLVVGAQSGRYISFRKNNSARKMLLVIEIMIMGTAMSLPMCLRANSELLIYVIISAVGWAVGAEFHLANILFREAGGSSAGSASVTDATDHLGAALGALVMGVFLVPVFGVSSACMILASIKLSGVMMLMGIRCDPVIRNND